MPGHDQRHVHAIDPGLHEALVGLGNHHAHRRAGSQIHALVHRHAEHDAVAWHVDQLARVLVDLDVDGRHFPVGRGNVQLGGAATCLGCGDDGVVFARGAFQRGLGRRKIGARTVQSKSSQFVGTPRHVAAGHQGRVALVVQFIRLQLELLGVHALLRGIERLRLGQLLTVHLRRQVVHTLLRGGTTCDGGIVLQAQVREQVRIIVLQLDQWLTLAHHLVLHHEQALHAPLHRRLDVHASIERIECDHATAAANRLLPRQHKQASHQQRAAYSQHARQQPRTARRPGQCHRRQWTAAHAQLHRIRGG